MQLVMYINRILVSSISLNYEGLLSCEDKEQLQESIVAGLIIKHGEKLRLTGAKAEIFVDGVRSKMNILPTMNS